MGDTRLGLGLALLIGAVGLLGTTLEDGPLLEIAVDLGTTLGDEPPFGFWRGHISGCRCCWRQVSCWMLLVK